MLNLSNWRCSEVSLLEEDAPPPHKGAKHERQMGYAAMSDLGGIWRSGCRASKHQLIPRFPIRGMEDASIVSRCCIPASAQSSPKEPTVNNIRSQGAARHAENSIACDFNNSLCSSELNLPTKTSILVSRCQSLSVRLPNAPDRRS